MIMPIEHWPHIPDLAHWRNGQEDPLRVIRGDGDDRGHPLQYAVIGHPRPRTVVGTGDATDQQIRALLPPGSSDTPIERFNRCPTCEQWSPCGVRTAWRDKPPAEPDPKTSDAGAEHRARVEVTAEPDADPLEAASPRRRTAGWSETAEQYPRATQTAALLSIAKSVAAVQAAVVAAMPGVLRTLEATGKALSDAYSGQTAALRRMADALEASGLVVGTPGTSLPDIETNDLEALARSADGDSLFVHVDPAAGTVGLTHTVDDRSLAVAVNGDVRPEVMPRDRAVFELLAPGEHTKHSAERLRMRLDRVRELAESRQVDDTHGGRCDASEIWPSEIFAILDGSQGEAQRGAGT